ncbi:MAG: hypothetical protein LZ173_09800 [Thaumarchaeota archaeon]|nr:hypothetical protein [Candidatus Geocrenenecus arthurdayi]
MELHELLTKKKTIGEWRLTEELTPVIDRLVQRDALLRFMDSVLKYIDEEVARYEYYALTRIDKYATSITIHEILVAMREYINPERAIMKVLEYPIASMFNEILYKYHELLEEREEREKEKIDKEINKYISVLIEYAERYPHLVVKGLITFADMAADAVKDVKEEIDIYGHPLM